MQQYTKKVNHISAKDRVIIGGGYLQVPTWKKIIGIPLIYIPALVSLPFTIIGIILVRWHLLFLGAKNLKKYKDFIPKRSSYRYHFKNQIIMENDNVFAIWVQWRIYWFYNCGIYCPLSIGLFSYCTYLVKIVENWWCPFYHDKKSDYADAPIDSSAWHTWEEERNKLHKDDLDCPIWNKKSDKDMSGKR